MDQRPKPERRPEPEDFLHDAGQAASELSDERAAASEPLAPEVPAEVRELREILAEINALMDSLARKQPAGR